MSPISDTPMISAEKISGTISMKIRLRNRPDSGVVTQAITPLATSVRPGTPGPAACTIRPSTRPSAKPMPIFQCKGSFLRVVAASVI